MHNPNVLGSYGGHPLRSNEALLSIEKEFSQVFNTLVELYKKHQYKLVNFEEV